MDFLKKWEPKKKFSKFKGPLRPQLEEAIRIINLQMQKLDFKGARIREYDRALFGRVVHYYGSRDIRRAKIYANELTEVRKLAKVIATTRLALEQITVRLGTVREYGDVAANVAPALVAMKGIYPGISEMVPEADQSFMKLGDLLDGLMVEAVQHSGRSVTPAFATEEGENILKQAATLAEVDLEKTLPDIPNLEKKKERLGV